MAKDKIQLPKIRKGLGINLNFILKTNTQFFIANY